MALVNDQVRAQLLAAVEPRPADHAVARDVVLEMVASGTRVSSNDIMATVYQRAGLPAAGDDEIDAFAAQRDPSVQIDPDQRGLLRRRLWRAVREELADLEASGTLVPMMSPDGAGNDAVLLVADVTPGGGGTRRGGAVPLPTPSIAEYYRLGRRLLAYPAWLAVQSALSSVDLRPLLGSRGDRCYVEALQAFRQGLFLAAVNMVGAASEAAWYSLGELLRDDAAIARALDEDATARLMKRVAEKLRAAPRMSTTTDELVAHAAFLRDLRNYGLHPRTVVEEAREGAFTETGCLTIIMETHRYLVRLLDASRAAGLDL